MKVIIAGSRSCETNKDYQKLKTQIKIFEELYGEITEIVSGHAPHGIDPMGEWYAQDNNIKLTLFPANWNKFGHAAGMIRNEEMAKYAEGLIYLWDAKSPGTRGMIKLAGKYGLSIIGCNCHK